ncbi:MAG: hypothetical protein ACFFD4_18140 [Candidatus Odinarchaeota archaeon]
MSNQTLTRSSLLKALYERQNKSTRKTMIENIEMLLNELQLSNIETSRRTLYRRLSDLRKEGLIVQTNEYYRKYMLKPVSSLDNVIVVDQENRILDRAALDSYSAILTDEGEIRLQVIEITEKGKEYMEKSHEE